MSSDEKLLNDVSEAEDSGYLEVYLRFNDDLEKDYCFQIKVTNTFRDLYGIFEKLPIALRPSIFYNSRPVGFRVSTSPGYLTEDGALLFDYNATDEKFLKNVSLDDKISDKVWPDQLIVPVWELNTFGLYSFISLLLVWLYTDLPDFISPTPGICLTNQATKVLSKIASYYGKDEIAANLIADISDPVSITVQIVFFVIHVVKLAIIFLFVYTGAFNPIKVFRFGNRGVNLEITRDQLIELGWTGSRRATPDEYKEFYRDYKIKEHGGMIQAHKAGVFETLKNLGVLLGEGEGFNTPLDSKSTWKDLLSEDNQKFVLSYEYLARLGEFFALYTDQEGVDLQEAIKQYRRYGLLHSSDSVKKIVQTRKVSGDSNL